MTHKNKVISDDPTMKEMDEKARSKEEKATAKVQHNIIGAIEKLVDLTDAKTVKIVGRTVIINSTQVPASVISQIVAALPNGVTFVSVMGHPDTAQTPNAPPAVEESVEEDESESVEEEEEE